MTFNSAQRALKCGYPERFAQQALGHNSKAVHHAYSKHAEVTVPSLEEYEQQGVEEKVIPFLLNPNPAPTLALQGDRPTDGALYETPVSGPTAPTPARLWRNAG